MDDSEIQRISVLLDLQRPAEAEARARTFLSSNPNSDPVLRLLAVAVHAQGRTTEALQAATLAASIQPDEAMNHIVLADLYMAASNRVKAIRAADEAARLAPHHWRTHFTRANVLRTGNQAERQQAVVAAELAAALDPLAPDAHNLVGLCLSGLGRAEEQREAYLRALRLDPQHVLAKNNLAALDLNKGRLLSGRRALTSALASSPQMELMHRNHDVLVLRVLTRAWWVATAAAWIQGVLLANGVGVAIRMGTALVLMAADTVMVSYLLGGPAMALRRISRTLHRVPHVRRGLLVGWFVVIAGITAFTTQRANDAAAPEFSATIVSALVTFTIAVALRSRDRTRR